MKDIYDEYDILALSDDFNNKLKHEEEGSSSRRNEASSSSNVATASSSAYDDTLLWVRNPIIKCLQVWFWHALICSLITNLFYL